MTKLSDITGNRPKVYNLKDNDTLKDKTILIQRVTIHEGGEFGVFVVMTCLVLTPIGTWSEPIVITTGASDIIERIIPLAERINSGEAIEGTLTKLGRKWLID